jgi:hypothetical protein
MGLLGLFKARQVLDVVPMHAPSRLVEGTPLELVCRSIWAPRKTVSPIAEWIEEPDVRHKPKLAYRASPQ